LPEWSAGANSGDDCLCSGGFGTRGDGPDNCDGRPGRGDLRSIDRSGCPKGDGKGDTKGTEKGTRRDGKGDIHNYPGDRKGDIHNYPKVLPLLENVNVPFYSPASRDDEKLLEQFHDDANFYLTSRHAVKRKSDLMRRE